MTMAIIIKISKKDTKQEVKNTYFYELINCEHDESKLYHNYH